MTYRFPTKILGSRISLTYKKLTKILQRTWEKSYEVSKIGPHTISYIHANVADFLLYAAVRRRRPSFSDRCSLCL